MGPGSGTPVGPGRQRSEVPGNPSRIPPPPQANFSKIDALPSPGVNPLEGSPKCSYEKSGLGRRSRLPTLEGGRGSSWEPRD